MSAYKIQYHTISFGEPDDGFYKEICSYEMLVPVINRKKDYWSDLQVMRSAAGYYVGTSFFEYDSEQDGFFEQPGSRDSDYFSTREAAQMYLNFLNF